jgi:hypothetical protein
VTIYMHDDDDDSDDDNYSVDGGLCMSRWIALVSNVR